MKKSISTLALLFSALMLYAAPAKAPAKPRTLEGYPYHNDDIHVMKIARAEDDELELHPISDDVIVYDREGKRVSEDKKFVAARLGPSFVLLDGDVVIEVYQMPRDYKWGTYDGPGIRYNPESAPSVRTVEGYISWSYKKEVNVTPFDSNKMEVYPEMDTVYYNENGKQDTAKMLMSSGSGKVRVSVKKVNGKEFAFEVLMLPEQYGKNNNKNSALTAAKSGSSAASDDGWDSDGWDGWSDTKQGARDYEVKEAYGYIRNVVAGDNLIQIARADGKYKNFTSSVGMAPVDGWNALKCYDATGKSIKMQHLQKGSYVRYLIANKGGEDKIVEVRVLPEGTKYQEKEIDIPDNAITKSYRFKFKKTKKSGFDAFSELTQQYVFFKVTENTVVYDLYDREVPWTDLTSDVDYSISITYVVENNENVAIKICYD